MSEKIGEWSNPQFVNNWNIDWAETYEVSPIHSEVSQTKEEEMSHNELTNMSNVWDELMNETIKQCFNPYFQLCMSFKRLHPDAKLPSKANHDDLGYDLFVPEEVVVPANARSFKIPLGFAMAIPMGYGMEFREKSGLTSKTGLRVQAGIIEGSYRGEYIVLVDNLSDTEVVLPKHKAVCQGLLREIGPNFGIAEVQELDDTTRGSGGFGSTGR